MQGDWYRNEGNGDLLRLKITKTEVFSLSESKENFHLTRSIFQCKDDSFYLINEKNYNEISKYKLIKLTEDSLTFEQEGLLIHRFARMKN